MDYKTDKTMDSTTLAAITEETEAEDLKALAAAKVAARDAMQRDPSADNIAAFARAKKALREFLKGDDAGDRVFRNRVEALEYLKTQGYAIEKSKLYADAKAGRLKLQADKSISLRDLERYVKAINLEKPAEKAPPGGSVSGVDKQRHETELAREMARERKRRNDVAEGLLMPREQVHLELAGRVTALEAGFKHDLSVDVPGIMDQADRIADKTERNRFISSRLHDLVDRRLNEYANIRSFLAVIIESDEADAEEKEGLDG